MEKHNNRKHWNFTVVYFAYLVCVPLLAFISSYFLVYEGLSQDKKIFLGEYVLVATLLWILIITIRKEHILARQLDTIDNIYHTWTTCAIYAFLLLTYFFLFKKQDSGRLFNSYSLLEIFILSSLLRWHMLHKLKTERRRGRHIAPAVILGITPFAGRLVGILRANPELGLKVIGAFGEGNENINSLQILGDKEQLKTYISARQVPVEYLFICQDIDFSELIEWADFCDRYQLKLRSVLNTDILCYIQKPKILTYQNVPLLAVNYRPLDQVENQFLKRAFDIIFSLLVIIFLLSWIVPLLGILICFESRGSIFFRQQRVGKNGKPFTIWKFRSMVQNSQADDLTATDGDARITKIGAFLRKTSIDELPQFCNVLLGQMSVVGPRPMMPRENERFEDKVQKLASRTLAKPGITGLAQVRGFRGGASVYIITGRVRLDRLYIYNWNFLLDIKIILLTMRAIIRRK